MKEFLVTQEPSAFYSGDAKKVQRWIKGSTMLAIPYKIDLMMSGSDSLLLGLINMIGSKERHIQRIVEINYAIEIENFTVPRSMQKKFEAV